MDWLNDPKANWPLIAVALAPFALGACVVLGLVFWLGRVLGR